MVRITMLHILGFGTYEQHGWFCYVNASMPMEAMSTEITTFKHSPFGGSTQPAHIQPLWFTCYKECIYRCVLVVGRVHLSMSILPAMVHPCCGHPLLYKDLFTNTAGLAAQRAGREGCGASSVVVGAPHTPPFCAGSLRGSPWEMGSHQTSLASVKNQIFKQKHSKISKILINTFVIVV